MSTFLLCLALTLADAAPRTAQTPAAPSTPQAGSTQQPDPAKPQGKRTGREADEDPANVAPQQPTKPQQAPAAKPEPKKEEPKRAGKGAKKEEPKADAKAEPAKPADPFSSGTFGALKLRLIGPALTSGRVGALAVNPKNKAHYYVGANSGGVWKTENSGTTWTPVFDREGSYSIGFIAMDPKNPAVVWVGTGEDNAQRSVAYGDGIYKTEDGGKSWKNMGLKKSEHIGRIIIDPRDSNTLYVAVPGPLWGPGGDRGVFKTTDGGKTWKNVLYVDEHTGA
ncbi:MAG TPA: hypothetical protein VD994_13730, partial [Prosthecobacter sp.]|nr:hypothetical protein [Prosthecobacter sp.]